MSYFVYLIITIKNNRTISYVGYTKDLIKRLSLHNSGKGAKFTRGSKWKIIYKKKYMNKKKAMSEEYKLKKNYILRNKIKLEFYKSIK
jgi:putative endonuclease